MQFTVVMPGVLSTTMLEQRLPPRPSKKRRIDTTSDGQDGSDVVIRHPLGVRPSGNAFTSTVDLKHACGGFALLPDELLVLLLEHLEAVELLRLGGTCRALHAFTRSEELWRSLFVEYVRSVMTVSLIAESM